MKKNTITLVLFVILFGLLAYTNHQGVLKDSRIRELEDTIRLNNLYNTQAEMVRAYSKKVAKNLKRDRTINDSLIITYKPLRLSKGQHSTNLEFKVHATSMLNKEIKYISGILVVKDSTKIIVSFPAEISPDLSANLRDAYWEQSWNLKQYLPSIAKSISEYDVTSLETEWRTSVVMFEDNTGLILSESEE